MTVFEVKQDIWSYLQQAAKPIVLYGMGNGGDKLIAVLESYGLTPVAVFASDDFVRGQSFHGFKVKRLCDIEHEYKDFIILVAFAAGYRELIDKLYNIAEKHELYAPDLPVYGGGLFNLEYLQENESSIRQVYSLLSDEQSRNIYNQILLYKLSGDISLLKGIATTREQDFAEIVKPSSDEVYLDLGAYDGDTVEQLLKHTRGVKRILAVEPDTRNFRKLSAKFEGSTVVELYNVGAWECDTQLSFSEKAGRQSSLGEGKLTPMRSVDSLLAGENATYIKFDVEGAEAKALTGARQTIEKYKPKLEVALYHRNEDIFELPLMVAQIYNGYKLYIRKQPYIPAWEINLYANNNY